MRKFTEDGTGTHLHLLVLHIHFSDKQSRPRLLLVCPFHVMPCNWTAAPAPLYHLSLPVLSEAPSGSCNVVLNEMKQIASELGDSCWALIVTTHTHTHTVFCYVTRRGRCPAQNEPFSVFISPKQPRNLHMPSSLRLVPRPRGILPCKVKS